MKKCFLEFFDIIKPVVKSFSFFSLSEVNDLCKKALPAQSPLFEAKLYSAPKTLLNLFESSTKSYFFVFSLFKKNKEIFDLENTFFLNVNRLLLF